MDSSIPQLVADVRTLSYIYTSAFVVAAYDIILNCGREWAFIRRTPWSIGKGLYIAARYYGASVVFVEAYCAFTCSFVGVLAQLATGAVNVTIHHSIPACKFYVGYAILGGAVFVSFIVNIIAGMRLYALFLGSKIVLAVLLIFTLPAMALQIYGTIQITKISLPTVFIPQIPGGISLTGCFSATSQRYAAIIWGSNLVAALVPFLLMVGKFVAVCYDERNTMSAQKFNPLLSAFYRSGTLWFSAMAGVTIVFACVFQLLRNGPLGASVIPWLTTCQIIAGSRLILDLHDGDKRMLNVTEGLRTDLGTLWFAQADEESSFEQEGGMR